MPVLSSPDSTAEFRKLVDENPELVEYVKNMLRTSPQPGGPTSIRYTYPTWFYFETDDKEKCWAAPNPERAPDSSSANAYDYLVRMCPDTETAIKKLRQIRVAFKRFQKESR